MTISKIGVLLALSFLLQTSENTFDKTFIGWWASTGWVFEFKKDGTFKRTSSGHYGNTVVNGTYQVSGDTVRMLSGFEGTHGTVNETYLIDHDSLLIDLRLYYDYKLQSEGKLNYYNSRKRYDILKNPDFDAEITVSQKELDSIAQKCLVVLEKQKIPQITDQDHVAIIRLINTMQMSRSADLKRRIYSDFMKLVGEKDYEKEMSVYYDWIPNRGMGFYFQKLQIELGGTPHLYSYYMVK